MKIEELIAMYRNGRSGNARTPFKPVNSESWILAKEQSSHPAGSKVYRFTGYDYGLSSDDTRRTGIQHISVTLDPSGEAPCFTVPVGELLDPSHSALNEKAMEVYGQQLSGVFLAGAILESPTTDEKFLAGAIPSAELADGGTSLLRTSPIVSCDAQNGLVKTQNSVYALISYDEAKGNEAFSAISHPGRWNGARALPIEKGVALIVEFDAKRVPVATLADQLTKTPASHLPSP